MFFKHLAALWVALALVAGGVGYGVYSGRNNRAAQNNGLHTFICFFENAVLNPKAKPKNAQTPAQRVYVIKFFNNVNDAIHEPHCTSN